MGYRLAKKVRKDWAELNSGPYRLLDQIAQTIPDDGNRRCWFGIDEYAKMIGREPNQAGRKSAQRFLKALVTAGALRLVQSAHRGRTTIYKLVLPSDEDGLATPSKVDGMVDRKVDTLVDEKVDGSEGERWTVFDQKGGQKLSTLEEKREERTSPSVRSSHEGDEPNDEEDPTVCVRMVSEQQIQEMRRRLDENGFKAAPYKADYLWEITGRRNPRELTATQADQVIGSLSPTFRRITPEERRAIFERVRATSSITEPGD